MQEHFCLVTPDSIHDLCGTMSRLGGFVFEVGIVAVLAAREVGMCVLAEHFPARR